MAAPVAGQPPEIDRTIRQEPKYQSKAPQYGLLKFGLEGKDRVWLVLDGDTLYVDRNGNGDLTEPGKKIAADAGPGRDPEEEGYAFEVGEITIGGRTHKGLGVYFTPLRNALGGALAKRPDAKAMLAKDPKALAISLRVEIERPDLKGDELGGRVLFKVGPVDLNGPLAVCRQPSQARR